MDTNADRYGTPDLFEPTRNLEVSSNPVDWETLTYKEANTES
jgi:hypothetical protein